MECKACKREEAKRKRPEWFDPNKRMNHTCNQPERLSEKTRKGSDSLSTANK